MNSHKQQLKNISKKFKKGASQTDECSNKNKENKLINCPKCDAKLLKQNLQKHLIKAHSFNVDETPSSEDKRLFKTTTANNVRNNPFIFCPKCDQRMLKSRLDEHLKIHYKNKIIPKWISRKCQTCGSIYHVHKDWLRFSKLCKSCNNDKKSNKKGYTNYAQASFDRIQGWGCQGGAPGLGKKR